MAELPLVLELHHRDGTITFAKITDRAFTLVDDFTVPPEPNQDTPRARTYRLGAQACLFFHMSNGNKPRRETLCRVARYWEEASV